MQRFKIREDHIGVFENYVDDRLIDKNLKEYRYEQSKIKDIPPYCVFGNKTMLLISNICPNTLPRAYLSLS